MVNKYLKLMASCFFSLLILVVGGNAQAQLAVEVSGFGGSKIALALTDISGNKFLSDIIRNDLSRTSSFNISTVAGSNTDYNVSFTVIRQDKSSIELQAKVSDQVKKTVMSEREFSGPINRMMAHKIADYVYYTLTGVDGNFSTRIAYVVKHGTRYELQVADADGNATISALISKQPIISPKWSPDGKRIAYVSFEQSKPIIYVQVLATGQRIPLANFKGSNSSPAWHPSGNKLAVVLTRDGISQLYTINANGSGVNRLHSSKSIDTEPVYSADGQWLYFTSDRSGGPQIYRIPAHGGTAERITYSGDYNVSANIAPDGKNLAYISRAGGQFNLVVMDLKTGSLNKMTQSGQDESPSFAPNSQQIIYATTAPQKGLAIISTDGTKKTMIKIPSGEIRQPTWGPKNS